MLKLGAHSGEMLDSGCLMLAFKDFSNSEIENHPVSRCQYPGSANDSNGFSGTSLNKSNDFMQLEGKEC